MTKFFKGLIVIAFLLSAFTVKAQDGNVSDNLFGQWRAANEDYSIKDESTTRMFFGKRDPSTNQGTYVQHNSPDNILHGKYTVILTEKKTNSCVVLITFDNGSNKIEKYRFSGGNKNIEQFMNFMGFDIYTYLTYVDSKTRP